MDISLILSKNYNGSIWTLNGDDYSGLTWLSETPKPTEKELQAQWADVKYQLDLEAVNLSRHSSYTAAGGSDAVFMKWQRGEATEQDWLDAVQAINDAHPYPMKEGK